MFDMGWTEILLIGTVALIVVGPKDLPRMLRTLGQYVGKMRGMAREFQRSMDDAAREVDLDELKDVRKSLNAVSEVQYEAQRAMSQSFLDGSGPGSGTSKADAAAKTASKAATPDAPATEGRPAKVATPAAATPAPTTPAAAPAKAAPEPPSTTAPAAAAGPAPGGTKPDAA